MSRLIALYPRAWRDRYEDEFLRLIADRPPTIADRFDVVRGALDARLHPQVRSTRDTPPPVPEGDVRFARRLGFASVIGGAVWPLALAVAATGPIVQDAEGPYVDGSAALPFSVLAVILLSAGLVGQVLRLPLTASVARASAATAIPFLVLYGMAPWLFPLAAIALACLVTLAIAGRSSDVWPVVASLAVLAGCVAAVAIFVYEVSRFDGNRMAAGSLYVFANTMLIPVWLAVGGTLIRQPATSTPAAP